MAHGKRGPQEQMDAYRAQLDELYRELQATSDPAERRRIEREIDRVDRERMSIVSRFIRRLRGDG